jgi:hypothetical protein
MVTHIFSTHDKYKKRVVATKSGWQLPTCTAKQLLGNSAHSGPTERGGALTTKTILSILLYLYVHNSTMRPKYRKKVVYVSLLIPTYMIDSTKTA